ncbi:hypothetical protein CORC01_00596 [Colletotrichum orchidophilum]|uniref:DUF5597 domain-containing protein n=1 Tax=Colletotrichum orchidophilum TaxID=1209926 RepID=A0A1G4BSM4_9PEZI|nr:uncharacterized protein CORC01_00596 [Colletotrichum orchidophilum]OHF04257.1 hypothetical protein CORC01_00596 [Colletotrichum orchidophilum]
MADLNTAASFPHFKKEGDYYRLIIDGEAFLIIGGQVKASASSSAAHMARQWQKIQRLGINTVLLVISWEAFESTEGRFNRDLVMTLIAQAGSAGIRVLLTWYGSLKGGTGDNLTSYAPSWIKMDPARFPRMKGREGGYNDNGEMNGWKVVSTPSVSLFGPEFLRAERKAYYEFMKQVKAADPDHNTIIMLQIGSEMGHLSWTRDVCDEALTAFDKDVPDNFLNFLVQSGSELSDTNPHCWEEFANSSEGTDEVFTTYHVATHINSLAGIAKRAFPVPVIVNIALEAAEGRKYGAPQPETLHLWKAFAPNIDLYAPRMTLLNPYEKTCEAWGMNANQPLLVQAHPQDDEHIRQLWTAFGSHGAIGVVLSTIEQVVIQGGSTIANHSALLRQAAPFLLNAQNQRYPHIGIAFGYPNETDQLQFKSGDFDITIKKLSLGGFRGGGHGLAISQDNGKVLLIGCGFEVRAKSHLSESDGVNVTRILSFHELEIDEEGGLRTLRMFNADETNGGRVAKMDTVTPMIAEVQFYCIKD